MRAVKQGKYPCPICGFRFDHPIVDFDICPSCGTEFGIDTVDHTVKELRDIWIANGLTWQSGVDLPPKNWNAYSQLMAIIPRIDFAPAANQQMPSTMHFQRPRFQFALW
jgi:hypothetical protein